MNKTHNFISILIALLAISMLLAMLFAPKQLTETVEAQPELTDQTDIINLQASIIEQLSNPPPSPQGIIDLSKLNEYMITTIQDTGSMLPTMNEHSKVLLSSEPVCIGDIVCYQNGEDIWVHRIIGEDGDYWLCQGDNNRDTNQTEYVPKDEILWRVMGILY